MSKILNIEVFDFRIYLAIALGVLFPKVVLLCILTEGNLSYIQAKPDRLSQAGC